MLLINFFWTLPRVSPWLWFKAQFKQMNLKLGLYRNLNYNYTWSLRHEFHKCNIYIFQENIIPYVTIDWGYNTHFNNCKRCLHLEIGKKEKIKLEILLWLYFKLNCCLSFLAFNHYRNCYGCQPSHLMVENLFLYSYS